MHPDQLPDSLTRLVVPRAVRVYAEGLGWRRVEGINGKIAVYTDPVSPLRQLIVPLDERLDDYALRTAEAIRRLAEFENRPADELLNQLLLPPSDLLFFREVSSEAEAGNLPLDHAVRMIEGTKNILLSEAHSVLKPQRYHPRRSRSEAKEFISRCRLGQTERGSCFVLTIACPLELESESLPDHVDPFARRVTSLLMRTLDELVQAADQKKIDELADITLHPGISANLCESLLFLRPAGDRSSLYVTVSWSRTLPSVSHSIKSEIQLTQEIFNGAEVLVPKLRSAPEPRIDRFFAWVDELKGQPTWDDPRPSGEVCFILIDKKGGETRLKTKGVLDPEAYAKAGIAHFTGDLVRFKGILERRPRWNQLKNVTEFEIAEFGNGVPQKTETTSRA